MVKFCSSCGIKSYNHESFCMHCGSEFEGNLPSSMPMQPQVQPEQTQQQYTPPSSYPDLHSSSKSGKPMMVIIAIIVAAMIAVAGVAAIFTMSNNDENDSSSDGGGSFITDTSFSTSLDGPVINLQSLASGNFQSIPAEGYYTKYGYYLSGEKIGFISLTNTGITTYSGKECYKIIGDSNFEMEQYEISLEISMDYTYYVVKSNMMPIYMTMDMDYDYDESLGIPAMDTITMNFYWDHNTGEMTATTSMLGETITMSYDLPQDYWGITSFDDLPVTFTFDTSLDIPGASSETILTTTTVSKEAETEDVTAAGKTWNCNIVNMDQVTEGSAYSQGQESTVNMKMWVTDDGIVPKIETTSTTTATVSMTLILEEYSQS